MKRKSSGFLLFRFFFYRIFDEQHKRDKEPAEAVAEHDEQDIRERFEREAVRKNEVKHVRDRVLERTHYKDEHTYHKSEDLREIVARSAEILNAEIDHYAAHECQDQHAPPRVSELRFDERFVDGGKLFINSRQVHYAADKETAEIVSDDDYRQVDDARLVLFFYVTDQLSDLAGV